MSCYEHCVHLFCLMFVEHFHRMRHFNHGFNCSPSFRLAVVDGNMMYFLYSWMVSSKIV
jgi:hypothetical protein